jgi:nucleotide-binding universal stress UspA family protein
MKGEVADCIREQAAESGADLVVMTTHGRGPLARFWLGSVADELVRRSPVPLLLVRPRETAPDPGQEPDLGRVLLPLDGSTLAEQIIEPAVALGGLAGAEYTLLRVVRPAVWVHAVLESPDARREAQSLLDRVEDLRRQVLKEAEDYLTGVAQRLRARGLRVQTRVAVDEHPAGAILHEAAAGGAGLIALATHGRRGLSRLLLGSVADKVVRGAPVPVLVHRPAAAPPGEKAAG